MYFYKFILLKVYNLHIGILRPCFQKVPTFFVIYKKNFLSYVLFQGMDTANLRQPIETTTVTGLKQALHVLSTGSSEVKNTLTNEVNLIYECKVCFSLFRSIANLIAHKRQFCKLKTAGVFHVNPDEGSGGADDATTTVVIQPEDPEPKISCTWNLHNHSPSMELIQTAGRLFLNIVS